MLRESAFGDVVRLDSARTILGRGRYWTSAYLVDGLLIDTGCAYTAGELLDTLKAPPQMILNTHSHEDHIGANGPLQQRYPGLEIRIHPAGLRVLRDPRGEQPLHPYRRLYWGWPQESQGKPLTEGETISTEKYSFEVIYTPGHSIDHVCFYEPQHGWLFSGDLYVGGREKALRVDYDIWMIIDSLKKVVKLPLTTLFPGAASVRSDPTERIGAKVDYLESLGAQVTDLHRQGLSVPAIARQLFGGLMQVELVTLGHFSRAGLVRSFLHQSDYPEVQSGEFAAMAEEQTE